MAQAEFTSAEHFNHNGNPSPVRGGDGRIGYGISLALQPGLDVPVLDLLLS